MKAKFCTSGALLRFFKQSKPMALRVSNQGKSNCPSLLPLAELIYKNPTHLKRHEPPSLTPYGSILCTKMGVSQFELGRTLFFPDDLIDDGYHEINRDDFVQLPESVKDAVLHCGDAQRQIIQHLKDDKKISSHLYESLLTNINGAFIHYSKTSVNPAL